MKHVYHSFHIICLLALLVPLAFSLVGCGPLSSDGGGKVLQSQKQRITSPVVPAADSRALADGNTDFAFDFYQAVRSQDGNLFFSPHSLSIALAMTYAGARGETAAQMAQVLHFNLPQENLHPAFNALDQELASRGAGASGKEQPFQLNIANSLWGQQDFSFLPEFLDGLALNYGAGLRLLDFAANADSARQEINKWVEDQTKEKIKDLIPQGGVDSFTRLVLANAIYFKADWLYPFEKNNTQPMPFTLLDGSQVDTPMMSFNHAVVLPYLAGDTFQVVELPYVGESVSMLILVPAPDNFENFEATLDGTKVRDILSGLQPEQVSVVLPKFSFDVRFDLKDTLAGMGMPVAFDPSQADFSGMDGKRDLYIGNVFHKAFVAVDEKGTEAAAASAVVMELSAAMPGRMLVVDRPFIFLIRDQSTGSVLFVGRVLDPAK
jgi:serpin B